MANRACENTTYFLYCVKVYCIKVDFKYNTHTRKYTHTYNWCDGTKALGKLQSS